MGKKRWNKLYSHSLIGTNILKNFSKYNNNNIHLYIKTRHEVINSWQCVNRVKSVLSSTHTLTDVNLTTEWKPSRTRWTDLDPVEDRYLAVGSCDGHLYLYDTSKSWITKKFTYVGIFEPVYPNSYTGQVTCVQWYPFDAGLITSSSAYDCNIRIWDPNILAMVDEVKLFVSINHHHLSPVASNHSLIAAALKSGEVALCDLRIGAAAHRLCRHKSCTFVQWSKHDQNILASGGIDNLICIWDVRSSKACLKAFNEDRLGTGNIQISSLAYTYDGLWLISLSSNSKSPVTFWNSKTYSKRNINIKIPEQYPSYRLQIDFTRNYYPDILYVPTKSQILAYDMSTGSLINTLHCPDSDLYGVIHNPSNDDIYGFGAKKFCLVFSPKLLQDRQQEENEEFHHLKRQKLCQNDRRSANTTEQIRNIHEDDWSSSSDEN